MDKMELYHFHKLGDHDDLWNLNQIIDVNENFNSTMYQRFQNFTTAVSDGNNLINYYDLISMAVSIPGFINENLMQILQYGFQVAFRANEFKRESALENYRLAYNSKLPSRLHCIYLTDEKGVKEWVHKFGNANLVLYRVEITGNIFKTNEQLIPNETFTYQQIYDAAYDYWHPNFKKVPDSTNEYLVQGKLKILEKIKN